MKLKNPNLETSILIAIYLILFFFFIFQEAIFTHDSFGYLLAMPQRNPGYVIFIKFFEFIFPENFGKMIVGFQLIFGLFAVHLFLKSMSKLLQLNYVLKIITLIFLLLPFFPPLSVANNVCSEGLAYPLYLLFLVLGFKYLYKDKKYTFILMFIVYTILALTRGQFIVTSIIFAFVYFFKYRHNNQKGKYVTRFVILLMFPMIVIFADKIYHKLKDGLFITTPYSFVNMSGAAFYVANENDVNYIDTNEYRHIFEACYEELKNKKLLMSSKKRDGYDAYYQYYHDNVPKICNQTVHDISRGYYFDKYLKTSVDEKAASVFSMWQSELACKNLFFVLVKRNFKDWSQLYYSNLVHGFKSTFVLLFVIGICIISCWKVIVKEKKTYEILFIFSALTLSNALIVSLASHSIMRYLFYNYVLILFMILLIIKSYINAKGN